MYYFLEDQCVNSTFLAVAGEVSSAPSFSDIPAYVLSRLNLTARQVLFQRQRDGILPKFHIWDDVRTFDGRPWRGKVDVVCGGFPCGDISGATWTATGIEGKRSGLWKEMARTVREVEPAHVFVENSPRLTIRGLGTCLRDLAQMGFDAKWGVFSAADAGARHERERIWIKASHSDRTGLEGRIGWATKGFFEMDHLAAPRVFPQDKEHLPAPTLLGSGHGLAHFVDRTRAIGNGQVCSVVRLAWETLTAQIDQ